MPDDPGLDPALEAAVGEKRVSDADVREEISRPDADNSDSGPLDQAGPAANSSLEPGRTPERDPKPGDTTGASGPETAPDELKRDPRAIPGAYSGAVEHNADDAPKSETKD